MTVLEALQACRVIINDPSCYTRKHTAVDAEGNSCNPLNKSSCKWNIYGAIVKTCNRNTYLATTLEASLNLASVVILRKELKDVFNYINHKTALSLLDRAIACAKYNPAVTKIV